MTEQSIEDVLEENKRLKAQLEGNSSEKHEVTTKKLQKYRIVTFILPAEEDLKDFERWANSHNWFTNKMVANEEEITQERFVKRCFDGLASLVLDIPNKEGRFEEAKRIGGDKQAAIDAAKPASMPAGVSKEAMNG